MRVDRGLRGPREPCSRKLPVHRHTATHFPGDGTLRALRYSANLDSASWARPL